MASELSFRCLRRLRSGFEVDVDLRIPLDESPVTVLFGPSGSGKTTLLRMLAGLDHPDDGAISLGGREWFDSSRGIDLSPQERRAAFLFQDYALFPHLTVAANVAFAARPERVRELLKTFGLTELASRRPNAISGGQQQRVALARALASDPAMLLLDEPLSALDAPARMRMRNELRRMLLDCGVPAVVVTHDRMEAIALGDWMAVIVDGRIHQTGPVQDVFRHPADAQVAASVGVENVLPAAVVSRDRGMVTIRVGGATFECVDSGELPNAQVPVFACIRAEEVMLSRDASHASSARNRILGCVRSVILEGPLARVELDCGFPLVALITSQSSAELELRAGESVSAIVKATSVHLTAAGAGSEFVTED